MKLRDGMWVVSNTDAGYLVLGKKYRVSQGLYDNGFYITPTNPKLDMPTYNVSMLLAGGLVTIIKRKQKILLP